MMARLILCIFLVLFLPVSFAVAQATVEKSTIPFESVDKWIEARIFEIDFPGADSNYNALTAASDGKIYVGMNTHNTSLSCRFYSVDPKTDEVKLVAKIADVLGEDPVKQLPQGKIHTPMYEHKGKLWFATHTSFYDGPLPGVNTEGRITYQGGHLMTYDLKTGEFEDLGKIFANEGIITLNLDRENEIMYGLTWPSGLFISYDITTKDLRYWGAVQQRGEWGQHPFEWDRICRTLGIDPEGYVYGSTMDGAVWRCDPSDPRRVQTIEGLDLSRLPFSQSAEETLKGDFQNNWRVIEWNPLTKSFWGIHFECSTLFEFKPKENYIRALAELRPQAYQGMPRNPEISQLGFTIGPKNTVFYLAHGPALEMKDRPEVQSNLYLLTYNIDTGQLTNHGPILSANKRRVYFSESIAIAPDNHIYTAAWVEVIDPDRIRELYAARKGGAPVETEALVYEMALVQLPTWQQFVK